MSVLVKKLIKYLAFIGFGVFLGVLLIEVGARAFRWLGIVPYTANMLNVLYTANMLEKSTYPDPKLGWINTPGSEYQQYVPTEDRFQSVTINSQGFRDKEFDLRKPKEVYRIAVLGDSFSQAGETPLDKIFPKVMERMLNQLNIKKDNRYEVLNFGVGGYSTAQQYLLLKHHVLPYRPDLVLLAFFVGNDIYENGLENILAKGIKISAYRHRFLRPFFIIQPEKDDLELVPPSDSLLSSLKKEGNSAQSTLASIKYFLRKRLFIYGVVANRIENIPFISRYLKSVNIVQKRPKYLDDIFAHQYTKELENAWQVTERLLLKINGLAKKNGAEFLTVIIPRQPQFKRYLKDYLKNITYAGSVEDPEKPNRRLRAFLSGADIAFIDLLPFFQEYLDLPSPQMLYNGLDGHFSDVGHRLTAQAAICKIMAGRSPAIIRYSKCARIVGPGSN